MALVQALPMDLVDDFSRRRSSLRKLLQTTTTAWTPTTADRYRPNNYPATWDWRSCKVTASTTTGGCYSGAVSGGITTGSLANTNANFVTTVRDQVSNAAGRRQPGGWLQSQRSAVASLPAHARAPCCSRACAPRAGRSRLRP